MSAYHHHAATQANALGKPLSIHGVGKRSAMALTCVAWAFEATCDSSLAVSIRGGRDEKREVDSMAEDDGS